MGFDKKPDDEDFESNPLLQNGATKIKESIADFKEITEEKRIYYQLKKHADEALFKLSNMQEKLNDGTAS